MFRTMKATLLLSCLFAVGLVLSIRLAVAADAPASQPAGSPLDFKVKDIDGNDYDLSQLKGKVVMFVNVASKCGYTPQYKGLQKLYDQYKKDGLVIVGVPANEFGRQEPGSDAQIAEFCTKEYGVTFPMLSKVVVKGEGICPLYKTLTDKEASPKTGGDIKWNFTKFLVGRDGQVVARFEPDVKPDSPKMTKAIEEELKKK